MLNRSIVEPVLYGILRRTLNECREYFKNIFHREGAKKNQFNLYFLIFAFLGERRTRGPQNPGATMPAASVPQATMYRAVGPKIKR